MVLWFLGLLLFSEPVTSPPETAMMRPIQARLAAVWPDPRHGKVTVVCHGHSVPAGYVDVPRVDIVGAYPHQLQHLLKERYPFADVHVVVSAVSGENALRGRKRFERDVLAHRPDVVTIDYSLNDRVFDLPTVRKAWVAMIEAAQRAGARVILLTPSADMESNPFDPDDLLQQHAAQVRALAAEYRTGLVDSAKIFKQRLHHHGRIDDWMSYSNHPNRLGHAAIARALFAYFLPALPSPNSTPPPPILQHGPFVAWRSRDGGRHITLRKPAGPSQALLVFGHGDPTGDSRARLEDPGLQAFADQHGLALVGLHGVSGPQLGESGAGWVWDALGEMGTAANAADISRLPFFAVGHENGGQTAFALAADQPQRCLGFVANAAWWFLPQAIPETMVRVPGWFLLGAHDPSLRDTGFSALQAKVAQVREKGGAWTRLIEGDKGREIGAAESFWMTAVATHLPNKPFPKILLEKAADALTHDAAPIAITVTAEGRIYSAGDTLSAGKRVQLSALRPGARYEWVHVSAGGQTRPAVSSRENNIAEVTLVRGLNLFFLKTFVGNQAQMSRPFHLFARARQTEPQPKPQLFHNQDTLPLTPGYQPLHLGKNSIPDANPHDHLLVAYRLTPEQETALAATRQGDGGIGGLFEPRHDHLDLKPARYTAAGVAFSQATRLDARLRVQAAYGRAGLYFSITVTDQHRLTPTDPADPNDGDRVLLFLDPHASKQIRRAYPGDILLSTQANALTRSFLRVDLFQVKDPQAEILAVGHPFLWRPVYRALNGEDALTAGIQINIHDQPPFEVRFEVVVPWRAVQASPDEPLRTGRLLATCIGYQDQDLDLAPKTLMWPHRTHPARAAATTVGRPVWGDLVLGPPLSAPPPK